MRISEQVLMLSHAWFVAAFVLCKIHRPLTIKIVVLCLPPCRKADNSACPDINPRDLVHYRGFYILWMLQLIECFLTMTFLAVYKVGKSRLHKLLWGILRTYKLLYGQQLCLIVEATHPTHSWSSLL